MEISDTKFDTVITSEELIATYTPNNIAVDELLKPEFMHGMMDRLQLYHTAARHPCKGEVLEEYIAEALVFADFKDVIGIPKSRTVGEDIRMTFNGRSLRISCKSGNLKCGRKNTGELFDVNGLEISSVRTTKFKTLCEKIEHINGDHEDIVMSVSSTLLDNYKKYVVTVIDPIKYNQDVNWEIYGKNNDNYRCEIEGVNAKIVHSMSDQLWYTLTKPYVGNNYVLGVREIYVDSVVDPIKPATKEQLLYWKNHGEECKKYISSR